MENLNRITQAFRIGVAFAKGLAYQGMAMDEWKSEDHPRDKRGRFAHKSGGGEYEGASSGFRGIRDETFKKVKEQGLDDGTYGFDGKPVEYKSGFQVSFQTSSGEDGNSELHLSDDEYDRIVNDFKGKGMKPHVGVFGGDPEISFHVKTLKEAFEIGRKYNQHSVWAWNRSEAKLVPDYDATTNKVNYAD